MGGTGLSVAAVVLIAGLTACAGPDDASTPQLATIETSTIDSSTPRSTVALQSAPSTTPNSSIATTTTTSSTTTTWTTTAPTTTSTTIPFDYGSQYLDLITPINCAGAELEQALRTAAPDEFTYDDWPAVREPLTAGHRAYALATARAIEAFVAADWPPELQPDIDALISELSAVAQAATLLSDAETFEQWVYAVNQPPAANTAASIIRAKLGLVTNIGAELDCARS